MHGYGKGSVINVSVQDSNQATIFILHLCLQTNNQ